MQVLVVDDDPEMRDELRKELSSGGYLVGEALTVREALRRYPGFQAVLLDTGLPDIDGYEVCRIIRAESDIPIIMLSGRDDEFERVLGLRLGADDFVTKPYRPRELMARIEAVKRRAATGDSLSASRPGPVRVIGPVRIELQTRRVFVDGREAELSRKEFDLLVTLSAQPGKVFTREFIMGEVWDDPDARDTRTLNVHMVGLRRKVGIPSLIQTVRGVGFRLAV